MLVGVGVDQLHIYADPVANAANAAFENGTNTERLSNFTNVGSFLSIWHNRCARDHLQVAYLRQVSEDVVLNAVRKIGILFFVAPIFKWQDCNRLIDLARGDTREEKEPSSGGNGHASCHKHDYVPATMRSGHHRRWCYPNALRGDVVRPGKDERDRKAEEKQDDHQAQRPVW